MPSAGGLCDFRYYNGWREDKKENAKYRQVALADRMDAKRFPELSTDRLDLCEITRAHVDWYFEHFNTPEIIAGQGFPGPVDMEAAKNELEQYIVGLYEGGRGYRWGIRLKGESEVIGSVGFYSWDRENAKA